MNHIRIDRRRFLAVAATLPLVSRVAFARAASVPDARFVFILLRGALDGLATVPPCGDPSYAGLRREIAIPRPGEPNGALALDTTFALHPGLPFLHECWRAKALLVAHAVATPYRERSHFDGQDVLENGGVRPNAFASGWLNRALTALPQGRPGSHGETGIALGQNLPLTMRGPAPVASWSPSRLPAIDDDTLTRIADLYARDPVLSVRLADALAADEVAQGASGSAAHNYVCQFGRQDAQHGILSVFPIPAHQVITLVIFGNQKRQFTGVQLKIAVQQYPRSTARFFHTCGNRCLLPRITEKINNCTYSGIVIKQHLQFCPCVVPAAVINHDNFKGAARFIQSSGQTPVKLFNTVFFIETGDDDGELRCRIHDACSFFEALLHTAYSEPHNSGY